MDNLSSLFPLIAQRLETPETKISAKPVHGGSINQCYQLHAGTEIFFCKVNSKQLYPGMFEAERIGLNTIAASNSVKVPESKHIIETEDHQCLIIEWIERGNPSDDFWKSFGESLAQMHSNTKPLPGFPSDNYVGSLRQINKSTASWTSFFVQQRLLVQVRLATDNKLLEKKHFNSFDHLFDRIDELFPEEPNTLLHGDLWSGNFMCDASGDPVIFDPAVYYGLRHVDLAMTTLFGGFDDSFYHAYRYHAPLPPDHPVIWSVLNLYPLLVHLNLFGSGYLNPIQNVLKHF